MSRYAVVEDATGGIWNVIEWDGETPLETPKGWSLVETDDNVVRGGTLNKGVYIPPPEVESLPEPPSVEDRLTMLESNIATIADAVSVSLPPPTEEVS